MRLLVCGGRDYADKDRMWTILTAFKSQHDVEVLIEGGAKGADTLARQWAEANGIPVEEYPADWDKYGKAAGPIRNTQMLKEGRPDQVIAFYDRPRKESRGTSNMASQTKNASVPILEIDPPR